VYARRVRAPRRLIHNCETPRWRIIFSPRRELPRGQRCAQRSRSLELELAQSDCMRLHARCTAPWPSGVIHSQRPPRRQSPSTFIMCALARARACARVFNYIFASQLPGERTTGVPPAEGRRRRGDAHGRSGLRNRAADVTRKSPRALILLLGNRRDRAADRSPLPRLFFYHPSAACGFA